MIQDKDFNGLRQSRSIYHQIINGKCSYCGANAEFYTDEYGKTQIMDTCENCEDYYEDDDEYYDETEADNDDETLL